jgi:hypothetical protein
VIARCLQAGNATRQVRPDGARAAGENFSRCDLAVSIAPVLIMV